jgi:hypothetical protein
MGIDVAELESLVLKSNYAVSIISFVVMNLV